MVAPEATFKQSTKAMFRFMFHWVFICTTVRAVSTNFTNRATYALDSFHADFNINTTSKDCQQAATDKSNEFVNRSAEFRAAVTIVHLYTQNDCKVNDGREFYRHLNSEINNTTSPYNIFAGLLNEAIDILSEEYGAQGNTVFRGQRDFFPTKGPYQPNRFTSTTTDFFIALSWSTSGCFVKIKNATGLYVQDFSAVPAQKEVLIKSTVKFMVDMKYVCTSGMFTKLKTYESTLNAAKNISHVTSIVELTQMPDTWNMTSLPVETDSEVGCVTGSTHPMQASMVETFFLTAIVSLVYGIV